MGTKPTAEEGLDDIYDILGCETQDTRKEAKAARIKALAEPVKQQNVAPTPTTKKEAPVARKKTEAAPAPAAPAKRVRAVNTAKGTPAPKAKAKAAAAPAGEARPRRKAEFAEGESDKMLASITKVMSKTKSINSKELAEKIGYAGQMHKVRPVIARAANAGVLHVKPGENPASGSTLVAGAGK